MLVLTPPGTMAALWASLPGIESLHKGQAKAAVVMARLRMKVIARVMIGGMLCQGLKSFNSRNISTPVTETYSQIGNVQRDTRRCAASRPENARYSVVKIIGRTSALSTMCVISVK